MSLAGLRKQLNKANQYVSERVGTAEATKLDDTYHEMERKVDATSELIEDIIAKTREYLQPNPAVRAKMATVSTISKLRGTAKSTPYPQQEGILADAMLKYGRLLGENSYFGKSLLDASETFKSLADIKYALEDNVKQNFIDPLLHLQANDLKEVMHHRKKVQSRRLDYDCKKRKQIKDQHSQSACDEELRVAEEKLEESKKLAEMGMFNILDNDVEQVSQLCAFVEAQLDFHHQTTDLLEKLSEQLKERVREASNRPHIKHIPKPVFTEHSPNIQSSRSSSPPLTTKSVAATQPLGPTTTSGKTNGRTWAAKQDPWSDVASADVPSQIHLALATAPPAPCCQALFDFEAESEGELPLREGQVVSLISQIDENWFEGTLPSGQTGYFPISYVKVLTPLP